MVIPAYGSGAMPLVWQPEDLEELQMLKNRLNGSFCYAAGATLLRTQWEGGLVPAPEHMISLARIPETSDVYMDGERIVIGALTRLNRCITDGSLQHLRLLKEAVKTIAAPSIRNVATIGGNIVSGVGDTLPALLTYNAELHWMTDTGLETRTLDSWLKGGRDGSRNPNDVLISIQIPMEKWSVTNPDRPTTDVREIEFYRKLGRRETFSASLVTIAFRGEIATDGTWKKVAIAAGGGSGMPMRLPESEQLLLSGKASIMQTTALADAAASEFVTYGDAFATEHYRKRTAGNLLGAGLWEALH
ncbi:FAD binding domain-containing protein [Paenibacillus pabuli]|uniref:FAD binding domain-containing protein n=1 Tax=Paenibacillus pabuli TaxID=1472 RepID=UPI0032421365